MNSYTLKQLFDLIGSQLTGIYPDTEILAIRKLLFDKIIETPHYNAHINPNNEVSRDIWDRVLFILDELQKGKPIQYIIGEADFMDLVFNVNPSVLIPRPETEELIRWIVDKNRNSSLNILDIGTGSGCIAIALAKYLSGSKVTALDISADALNTAILNATRNSVSVNFINANILDSPKIAGAPFDIIVSNPPYVRKLEKQWMNRNVTDFEPHLALFVSDNDPLLFYRTIAQKSINWLKPSGQIYFEINEAFGDEVKNLLIDEGFKDVEVKKDLNGKERMAYGRR